MGEIDLHHCRIHLFIVMLDRNPFPKRNFLFVCLFVLSHIQQTHKGSSEDHEAWQHVSGSIHDGGQPHEDSTT